MQRKFEYMRVHYHEPSPYNNNPNFISFHKNDERQCIDNVDSNKFWDDMGKNGWEIKGYSVHPTTFHFVIFQREIFSDENEK